VRSYVTPAAVSLSKFNFYSGMDRSRPQKRYLSCKQNLGHPVNDLFDLRTNVQPQETDVGTVIVGDSIPVENAFRQGTKRRDGGPEQPVTAQGSHAN
jgi:hypothetical protein